MQSARVSAWHKAEGEAVEEEELLVDVTTDNLSDQGYDVGTWSGDVTMQVECHDDGHIAKLLVCEGGEELRVGTPLALLGEDAEQAATARRLVECGEDVSRFVVRDVAWQAYVKAREGEAAGGMCESKSDTC